MGRVEMGSPVFPDQLINRTLEIHCPIPQGEFVAVLNAVASEAVDDIGQPLALKNGRPIAHVEVKMGRGRVSRIAE